MPSTILVIEDDADLRQMVAASIAAEGHRVIEADAAQVGLQLFRTQSPDLLILDVNLPDGTGFDVCRSVREHPSLGATPIVMLTGCGEFDAKSRGLTVGADQYLVKPIQGPELVLWVRALLRRRALDRGDGDLVQVGPLAIDAKGQVVRFNEQVLEDLTGREFDLLVALVRARPKVLSRKFILSKVWRTVATDNVVDAHVRNLRKKLPQALSDKLQTVPGRGFRYLA
ncbi:MAG: response regulator transcription factor [Elusimicrobia bacterium]|nr:response regulator transcription factor [Elusimicrobiota bacterium]